MALMLTKKDLADKFAQEMNVSKKDAARWRKH